MKRIDKAILDTNKVICDNIAKLSLDDRGLLSQNILSQLRNFVEYIAIKDYSNGQDPDPLDYEYRKKALTYISRTGKLRNLYKFHQMLQKSVSHYTADPDGSERLMLKYYEYLLKIKIFMKEKYDFDVLENINDFPLNLDTELSDYYKKIAEKIESPIIQTYSIEYSDRYYIQKVKPFFVNQKIYYEVTFTTANVNVSKFDRVIAFTKCEIIDNYAIKFHIHTDVINILDKNMSILIIDDYEVSIRPCEIANFSKIFGPKINCSISSNEYKNLMNFLSTTKMSLTELICSDQKYYNVIKERILKDTKSKKIYEILDQARKIIISNNPGANILRYLLYKMNNRVIKAQYKDEQCYLLSNLNLNFGCIPFDQMPFCSNPVEHVPKLYDLINSILSENREHELFARFIKNNTEINGYLFTSKKKIDGFENVDNLIAKYNKHLYYKHTGRKLKEYKNHIYINEYASDSMKIIKKLQDLASSGVGQYTASVDSWLSRESYIIDDESKKSALRNMFADSHVALIYGSAGTGKSTLIKHIANFWADKSKIFLANTHPAVDNMRRKITIPNSEYCTIAKFLSKGNRNTECDILFIDECSTVSNRDMRRILDKASFELLVLVGDIYQIESIYFGNWFNIARNFISKTSVFELNNPYRTTNGNLLELWKRVRKLDDSILEILVGNGWVAKLDESIFEHSEENEIILCLNYDGLYGINNINRILQNNNPNQAIIWGINTYKVNDPILFNESNIFSPLIHNNSKGRIVGIYPEEEKITFHIELEESINELDALGDRFSLVDVSEFGNSIISFSVNRFRSTDEDDELYDSTVVPFQVAYAVSIHKAQGLEYDSVKIVITNEVEERITHNIFYTAITRAKENLKIYWSPETEKSVLERLEIKECKKDAILLANLFSLDFVK